MHAHSVFFSFGFWASLERKVDNDDEIKNSKNTPMFSAFSLFNVHTNDHCRIRHGLSVTYIKLSDVDTDPTFWPPRSG